MAGNTQVHRPTSRRSEMLQEIVSTKPGFLIRWGNSFFLMILLLIIAACWFIRYPDLIQADAKLTSSPPPKPVINLIAGKLIKLVVVENQFVEERQVLGYIQSTESTARHEDVLRLLSVLDSIHTPLNDKGDDRIEQFFEDGRALGELQAGYLNFIQEFFSYKHFLNDAVFQKTNGMSLNENNRNHQRLIFERSLNTFRSQINEWKIKYILTAQIAGKVAFASFIKENQQLVPNQIVCFINPASRSYFVELMIPQASISKVAVGQKVLLRFHSYPFQEFGSLQGRINFISQVPTENGYSAQAQLVNGLITTHNRKIQYREGLAATGEIVTSNMRLLERFYFNIVRQRETHGR
ncbi:MAG TPA: HlyD family secretion protein [Chryseolinea sp.]|nr:HlyD family secretion protein [Chryseolinea sp.]